MNIVLLSPEAIFPVNTGGRIVVYNRIKYLSLQGNKIFVFTIVDSREEFLIQKESLGSIAEDCKCYLRKEYLFSSMKNSFSMPYAVASRTISDMQKDIDILLQNESIDLIDIEYPQMAINAIEYIKKYNIPCVLGLANIEYLSLKNIGDSIKSPFKKAIYKFEAKRLERFETRLYNSGIINAFTFVSESDKEYFETTFGNINRTFLSPIGAESNHNGDRVIHDGVNIMIFGKMSYPPNIEGVLWFYKNVWPVIKEIVKNVSLYIVGRDPSKELVNISDESVIVTGTVDSVEEYYYKADVVAIPIFSGGGVKTKLIEAISYNVPVVCTSSGACGTKFENEKHMFITDDSHEFANRIIEIIRNQGDVNERMKQAYQLFEKEYTWEGICRGLNDFLKTLIV
ncbi:glycosyltransferase family 4 protein [[Clostridium] fimetarium]|uniref:Glycosyltransferase involved in cell wall bisynthesis n=1 Tax=[Clostridium] fimetarium TaxID=99656 RepID=A0A1I0RLB6_9FIRM|nr:glycosyltransferase family 4 protein [[Clostridium] fimetarium]SEW41968.1 Glycosyltransferase involved in cell wall bisynthesis [[Clostridium] fimetarium]